MGKVVINQPLLDLCKEMGRDLDGLVQHKGQPVKGAALLYAIAGNESSFGNRRDFVKYEPAYLPGGGYYKRSNRLREEYYRYGVLAGSSFGSFQIMYPTAWEMGFAGHPIELQKDSICVHWAVQLIKERFVKHQGCKTLGQVLDAYNSGNAFDGNVPEKYVDEGVAIYEEIVTSV